MRVSNGRWIDQGSAPGPENPGSSLSRRHEPHAFAYENTSPRRPAGQLVPPGVATLPSTRRRAPRRLGGRGMVALRPGYGTIDVKTGTRESPFLAWERP